MAGRKAVTAALRRQVEEVVATIAINATAELVEATPVDTSWAASNWIPTVGAPHEGVVGSPNAVSAPRGPASQVDFKLGHGKAYVTNNVPYINRLNDGHSAQAPAGFVQLALGRAVASVPGAVVRRAGGAEP